MSRVSLTARRIAGLPALPIDASAIRPDTLCELNPEKIRQVMLRSGKHPIPLGDLFSVRQREGQAKHLTVSPANLQLDGLGAQMRSGSLRVNGNAGAYVGYRMRGGQLMVNGNAATFAGSEMRAGLLRITGNAGARAGAVRPGHEFGMRGGVLQIDGNCGARAGDRMRRGILLIGGDCANQCAHRMLAGTIIVNGQAGADNGFELRHGSLILANKPSRLLNSFADTGRHKLMFLRLLANTVKPYSRQIAARLVANTHCTRLAGDLAAGGRGEILVLAE